MRSVVLALCLIGSVLSPAQTVQNRFVGAWHLVRMEVPGPDGKPLPMAQPTGLLVYTSDGHVSIQLMYPQDAHVPSNEYVHDGYEASFGTYELNTLKHTVTHHVQASNTRSLLIGKAILLAYDISANGHWSVTWEHY